MTVWYTNIVGEYYLVHSISRVCSLRKGGIDGSFSVVYMEEATKKVRTAEQSETLSHKESGGVEIKMLRK